MYALVCGSLNVSGPGELPFPQAASNWAGRLFVHALRPIKTEESPAFFCTLLEAFILLVCSVLSAPLLKEGVASVFP